MSEQPIHIQATGADSGMLAQILVTTTQTQTDVAVMKEQLKAVPDHESRLRKLEQFRYAMGGIAIVGGGLSGYIGYLVGRH